MAAERWAWLPNAGVTRLHAISSGDVYRLRLRTWPIATACNPHDLSAPVISNVTVAGDPPPKCRRCLRVTGESDA